MFPAPDPRLSDNPARTGARWRTPGPDAAAPARRTRPSRRPGSAPAIQHRHRPFWMLTASARALIRQPPPEPDYRPVHRIVRALLQLGQLRHLPGGQYRRDLAIKRRAFNRQVGLRRSDLGRRPPYLILRGARGPDGLAQINPRVMHRRELRRQLVL